MRRWVTLGIIGILLLGLCLFSRTAIDPEDFTGEWYSPKDQTVYRFREGIIDCPKHSIPLSDEEYFSGAYAFSKDSILLFTVGEEGQAQLLELYLVEKGKESLLCDRKDGSGVIYFAREKTTG